MYKAILPVFAFLLVSFNGKAQHIRHTFSLMGNLHTASDGTTYTLGQGRDATVGGFSFPGFGYKMAYTFNRNKELFIETGIRFYNNKAKHTPFVLNSADYSSYSEYGEKFNNIMVPLHVGKTFISRKRKFMDVVGGVSVGYSSLMEHSASTVGISSGNNRLNDTLSTFSTSNIVDSKGKFMASADAGLNIAPFWKLPQLNFGLMLSYHLFKTPVSAFESKVESSQQGLLAHYAFESSYRFVNCLLSINYSFGKKWKRHLIYTEEK